jgi:hypothetical protein
MTTCPRDELERQVRSPSSRGDALSRHVEGCPDCSREARWLAEERRVFALRAEVDDDPLPPLKLGDPRAVEARASGPLLARRGSVARRASWTGAALGAAALLALVIHREPQAPPTAKRSPIRASAASPAPPSSEPYEDAVCAAEDEATVSQASWEDASAGRATGASAACTMEAVHFTADIGAERTCSDESDAPICGSL